MEDAQRLIEKGYAARNEGNLPLALSLYKEAADAFRRIGEPLRLAHTIRHVADIQRRMNLLELAQANYTEALAIYQPESDANPLDVANTLRGFALLSEATGDIPAARTMWTEARQLYSAVQVQAGVEEADCRLSMLHKM